MIEGYAYAGMTRLIADLKEAERVELNARQFLNELRMVYRPCMN
jgi:hypothetical protein